MRDDDFQGIDGRRNVLDVVWRNGELLRDDTFAAIRARAAAFD